MKIYFNQVTYLNKLIFLVLAVTSLSSAFAQGETYSTSAGQLIIKAHLDDKALDISSKNLIILLDYETGEIEMRQEVAELYVNNDSMQSEFKSGENKYIRFEGKLGLDYINTQGHPPLDFMVEGTIYPGNKHVIGNGRLVHIVQGTTYSCLLSLSFTLQPSDIFPDYQLSGTNNEIHIKVIQSLLARENE